MAGPTQAERRLIYALHRNDWSPEEISEHYQVSRAHQAVREVLAEAGLLPPIRPKGIDTGEMQIITDAYKAGMSIRACADQHHRSYGVTRKVLIFMGVKLRDRGGAYRKAGAS